WAPICWASPVRGRRGRWRGLLTWTGSKPSFGDCQRWTAGTLCWPTRQLVNREYPFAGHNRTLTHSLRSIGPDNMDHFHYRDRVLHCENVPVRALAEAYGTPLYVYSQATLLHHLTQIQKAFADVPLLICYSIKVNGNLHICRLMAEHGSGFDVT